MYKKTIAFEKSNIKTSLRILFLTIALITIVLILCKCTKKNLFSITEQKAFANDYDSGMPISTDSRIKTLIYSENEVFPIVLHFGYQTSIEFAKGEAIQTYSIGNNYAWQLSVVGRTLFLKPLEDNIITNMTILTNKRRYYFELISKPLSGAMDSELSYAIRFFYPEDELNKMTVKSNKLNKNSNEYSELSTQQIRPYNFAYKTTGDSEITPRIVFDDGNNTYFQYEKPLPFVPIISSKDSSGKKLDLYIRQMGNYFMVNSISNNFTISHDSISANVSKDK